MPPDPSIVAILAAFGLIALASRQVGDFFARMKLPLVSGFLLTGILAGPYVLGLVPEGIPERLRFLDELALAFIAFASGAEFHLKDMRSRLRSIAWVTGGLVLTTFTLGSIAVYFLANHIAFMREMPPAARIAVALLAGSILVARSPSSAIAVISELRAKGPYTQTALGVTVVMDVVVIVLFALCSSVGDALLTDSALNVTFVLLQLLNLLIATMIAVVLAAVVRAVLTRSASGWVKTPIILAAGYGVFHLSFALRKQSEVLELPFEVFLEPLLICMLAGFFVANFTAYRGEFRRRLDDIAPAVFIIFFTLTGASLDLEVLAKTWGIAVVLFFVRVVGIAVGSFAGGTLAGDPLRHNRISWMAFITQAGIGLGLAKEVAVEFPSWGAAFATILIAVIVLNQVVGPPFFKWAINLAGEARIRAKRTELGGPRDAIIFGLEGESLSLARQLRAHGWTVKVASRQAETMDDETVDAVDVDIVPYTEPTVELMQTLGANDAEAIVMMLSDDSNYRICELAYENFGTRDLIVRLHDHDNLGRFHELGALVVHPSTAVLGLLEHMVRSPGATSILMGLEAGQDMIDVELRNSDLDGLAVRDLDLPLDTHIVAVHRNGANIVCGGYTQLALHDRVTISGSDQSLQAVQLQFEE